MEQEIVQLLFGSGGIGVVIGTIMRIVKKRWKPEDKTLYRIPAGILSLGGGYLALQSIAVSGFWLQAATYVLISAFIMAFQLWGENEASWKDIKKIFVIVFRILAKNR